MKLVVAAAFALAVVKMAYGEDCESFKVKYGQLEFFEYEEDCTGDSSSQNALLGSGTKMDCGVDGALQTPGAQMIFSDFESYSYSYLRQLCLNVHGVDYVTIIFDTLGYPDQPDHVEDLTGSDGWNRFCVPSNKEYAVYQWFVYLTPKYDGSRVMVKNAKLAVCNFLTDYDTSTYHTDTYYHYSTDSYGY